MVVVIFWICQALALVDHCLFSAFFRLLTEAQIPAGIVAYYEDFLGLLSEAFGGRVKITCIGHIGHTEKDWEKGRLSSLQASQRQIPNLTVEFFERHRDKPWTIKNLSTNDAIISSIEISTNFPESMVLKNKKHPGYLDF